MNWKTQPVKLRGGEVRRYFGLQEFEKVMKCSMHPRKVMVNKVTCALPVKKLLSIALTNGKSGVSPIN